MISGAGLVRTHWNRLEQFGTGWSELDRVGGMLEKIGKVEDGWISWDLVETILNRL